MQLILSLITLQVCVADGTTTLVQLEDMIPSSNILIQPTNEEALSALLAGDCNTIYAGTNEVAEAVKEMTSQGKSVVIGDVQFNHEPIALVICEDDQSSLTLLTGYYKHS